MIRRVTVSTLWLSIPLLLAGGCQQRADDRAAVPSASATASPSVETDRSPPSGDVRRAIATQAKDDLFAKLSGRLTEVLQSDGPADAIQVCSQEAVKIAEAVGRQHDVHIGRTSFKLRNPANAARSWVEPLVEQRVDTPQHLELANGDLGVLFPIRLDVKCLMCHGGPNDILDAVKPELARLYPNDQATGFQQGDLRGWFWVEVPPQS